MSRPTSRTVKLTREELAWLDEQMPASEDLQEMTPGRDGADKIRAAKRELEARRNKHYYDCSPNFGPREQAYRDHLRKLRAITADRADVCIGCQVQFTAASARRAEQFLEEFVEPVGELLARGNREKRGLK